MVTTADVKQRQSIMVIYNDLDMIELLNEGLELDGYDIVVAVDEDEALKMLEILTPDLIIMNTVTADAHSLHILDSVKKKSGVPFIVITLDNEMETLKKMFEHGAEDIVHKPLNMRDFTARLRAISRRWYRVKEELRVPANLRRPNFLT